MANQRRSGDLGASGPPASLEAKISELLGLARGVLADGEVNEAEARALRDWMDVHPGVAREWPVSALARRLQRIFRDGRADPEERGDLADLLRRLVEGTAGPPLRVIPSGDLPLTDPPPVLTFQDRVYVFAGRFASGSVASRQRAVVALGGRCHPEVGPETDYLVVGAFGGRDWSSSPGADRIESALELQRQGHPVAIVSEDHWVASLPREPSRHVPPFTAK